MLAIIHSWPQSRTCWRSFTADLSPVHAGSHSQLISDLSPGHAGDHSQLIADLSPGHAGSHSQLIADLSPGHAGSHSQLIADLGPGQAGGHSQPIADLSQGHAGSYSQLSSLPMWKYIVNCILAGGHKMEMLKATANLECAGKVWRRFWGKVTLP